MELLEVLLGGGQKVLVFTQFTEMGALLVRALEERFDLDAGFCAGGVGIHRPSG